MHYQSKLLHARFLACQVGQLRELREISSACLPPRPASAAAAERQRIMANSQGELARSGSYGAAMSEDYSANERAMQHSAALAEADGVHVPRIVARSKTRIHRLALQRQHTEHALVDAIQHFNQQFFRSAALRALTNL